VVRNYFELILVAEMVREYEFYELGEWSEFILL